MENVLIFLICTQSLKKKVFFACRTLHPNQILHFHAHDCFHSELSSGLHPSHRCVGALCQPELKEVIIIHRIETGCLAFFKKDGQKDKDLTFLLLDEMIFIIKRSFQHLPFQPHP